MIRILRDCDHPKEKFRSCEHCTLKILRLRKEAVSTCKKNNHIITKEGIDVCNDCEKKLSQKEDSVKHDSTHVVPCSVCPSQETEYCIHNSTQKMRSLSPSIYSVVVFDNVKRQVRNTATYGGPNAVADFFAYLDELRPTWKLSMLDAVNDFLISTNFGGRKELIFIKKGITNVGIASKS